jgi:hypothetical protein
VRRCATRLARGQALGGRPQRTGWRGVRRLLMALFEHPTRTGECPLSGVKRTSLTRLECPLMTDAVEKLSDTQRAGNNRIQFLHSLNQCCAPASYLKSMLLTRASKNLFRQHRPIPTFVCARMLVIALPKVSLLGRSAEQSLVRPALARGYAPCRRVVGEAGCRT